MMLLPDTNIIIYVADNYKDYRQRFATLNHVLIGLSCLVVAELEAGLHADPVDTARREGSTRPILGLFPHLPFTTEAASLYGQIARDVGYNRRKALDRMLAAQALALNATLITANADDFADIKGLNFDAW